MNHLRWKSFVVVEINCIPLENIPGCMVFLCGETLLYSGITAIPLEEYRGYQPIHEDLKTFPPQMISMWQQFYLISTAILLKNYTDTKKYMACHAKNGPL